MCVCVGARARVLLCYVSCQSLITVVAEQGSMVCVPHIHLLWVDCSLAVIF